MKTPLQYVRRIREKQRVFNPDGATLNIVRLNRYVNGVPGKTQAVPDGRYLSASTSFGHLSIATSAHAETDAGCTLRARPGAAAFLEATLARDFMEGQHGQPLKETAESMLRWMFMDGGALVTPRFREQLQALAEALADGSDEGFDSESSSGDGDAVEASSSDASWVMSVPELGSEDEPERHELASEAGLVEWVRQLEVPVAAGRHKDLFDTIEARWKDQRERQERAPVQIRPRRADERV